MQLQERISNHCFPVYLPPVLSYLGRLKVLGEQKGSSCLRSLFGKESVFREAPQMVNELFFSDSGSVDIHLSPPS